MASVDIGDTQRLRWTPAALDEAIRADILDANARYEILDGELYKKMGQNWPHAFAIAALNLAFRSIDPQIGYVSMQLPMLAGDDMPEPDLAIVQGDLRQRTGQPKGTDLIVAIEVSDSSLSMDGSVKARIYASSGVPVYWIVDLKLRHVEVRSRPEGGEYLDSRTYRMDDTIPPIFVDAPAIPVASLMAPDADRVSPPE